MNYLNLNVYHTNHPITGEFMQVDLLAKYRSKKRAQEHADTIPNAFIEKSLAMSDYRRNVWRVFLPVQ